MAEGLGFDGGLTCALGVRDLQASIAWYRDVLGFELLYEAGEMGWCELRTPVRKVNVGLSQIENPEVRGGTTLTFGVQDVDQARARLAQQDVKFDGETQTVPGMVKLATFFDPDGNKLMLYQDLSSRHG